MLRGFADPAVAASTRESVITPDRLLDGTPTTLYVVAPAHEQERLAPVFSALVGDLLTAAYTAAATRPDGKLPAPLLVLLDEAANIAPLRDLDALASTAAGTGTGIQVVTIWQDLAQITARYGRKSATIVNNHRAKLALSGISDGPTLDLLARVAGDHETVRESATTGADSRVSTMSNTDRQPLTSPAALRRLPPGQTVVLNGHLSPGRLSLRRLLSARPSEVRS